MISDQSTTTTMATYFQQLKKSNKGFPTLCLPKDNVLENKERKTDLLSNQPQSCPHFTRDMQTGNLNYAYALTVYPPNFNFKYVSQNLVQQLEFFEDSGLQPVKKEFPMLVLESTYINLYELDKINEDDSNGVISSQEAKEKRRKLKKTNFIFLPLTSYMLMFQKTTQGPGVRFDQELEKQLKNYMELVKQLDDNMRKTGAVDSHLDPIKIFDSIATDQLPDINTGERPVKLEVYLRGGRSFNRGQGMNYYPQAGMGWGGGGGGDWVKC